MWTIHFQSGIRILIRLRQTGHLGNSFPQLPQVYNEKIVTQNNLQYQLKGDENKSKLLLSVQLTICPQLKAMSLSSAPQFGQT